MMSHGCDFSTGICAHLLLELFKIKAGLNIVHVPYRGTAPLLNAILAGEVQIMGDPMTTTLPFVLDGKVRAIIFRSARWRCHQDGTRTRTELTEVRP